MDFIKYHGIGNSFILMDNRQDSISDRVDLAKKVCSVNFGIGADGLILVEESTVTQIKMRIFNADGSEPEMCGNGVRCFTKFVLDKNILTGSKIEIETLAGTITCERLESNPKEDLIRVDMGIPAFSGDDFIGDEMSVIGNKEYHFVSMGNPHAVRFVSDFDFDYKKIGLIVEENYAIFPSKVNVEFIKKESENELSMRVWERGCGETMACGTGACASVVSAYKNGVVSGDKITVHLLGGDLVIEWPNRKQVMMSGKAAIVCSGDFLYK